MAATKLDFTDFTNMGGSIINGEYVFPTLYTTDSNNNTRLWKITVRLIKGDPVSYKINWNIMSDIVIQIKESYLTNKEIPNMVSAQYWVETGVVNGKITTHAPSYSNIKNLGRSNERNLLQQAIIEARSKFNKKKTQGGFFADELKQKPKNTLYYPMLASEYKNEIKYPVFAQPKLDGNRAISRLNKLNEVEIYSRGQKIFPDNKNILKFKEILHKPLMIFPEFYLDGELYKHGTKLQTISGDARNEKSTIKLQYHIYDVFNPSNLKLTFKERYDMLNSIYDAIKLQDPEIEYIMKVETVLLENKQSNDDFYNEMLSIGYEGIMIRDVNGIYTTSAKSNNGTRSKNLLKRKPTFDAEFEVVGYTDGNKGKDVGALIWICQTDNGDNFNVVPNGEYEERYKLFEDCQKNFDKKYKNRLLRVEYKGLSIKNIPLYARGILFDP